MFRRNEQLYADYENKARSVYISSLWNGQYLHYDSSANEHHDSIMADMLAGACKQWLRFSLFFFLFLCLGYGYSDPSADPSACCHGNGDR